MSCPACFSGGVHDHSSPLGRLETIHGVNTYITGTDNPASQSVILYLPDLFSLRLVNNKLLADRYARDTGCKVLFPDIVDYGGANPSVMPHMETLMGKDAGILAKIWAFFFVLPVVPMMYTNHGSKKFPQVLKYAREIKKSLPAGAKLGVAGFCWGGYGSTNLCSEPAVEGGSDRLIDAQFCGHPSMLTLPDQIVNAVKKFKVPYSCAVASEDFSFNDKEAEKVEAALRQQVGSPEENNYEFRIYKGAGHGFCVRAKPGDEKEMGMYEDAAKQAGEWFNKWLK